MLISGGNNQIVSHPKRDWQALERKMGLGWSLSEAADACGIPQPEAEKWADDRAQKHTDSAAQMRSVATASLKTALETLTKIVEEGPRYSETEYSEEGKPVKSVTPQNVDLDAAKALAVLAIQAIKISGAGKSAPAADAPGGVKAAQPDLWDSKGNWDLKQPK